MRLEEVYTVPSMPVMGSSPLGQQSLGPTWGSAVMALSGSGVGGLRASSQIGISYSSHEVREQVAYKSLPVPPPGPAGVHFLLVAERTYPETMVSPRAARNTATLAAWLRTPHSQTSRAVPRLQEVGPSPCGSDLLFSCG